MGHRRESIDGEVWREGKIDRRFGNAGALKSFIPSFIESRNMNPANIHVLPDPRRGWIVCREGDPRALAFHDTQATAIAEAKSLAIVEKIELIVHDRLGKIAKRLRAG